MLNNSRLLRVCIVSILHLLGGQVSEPNEFPDNFLLGFSTSNYQIEGGWNEDGKGEGIWDVLTHTRPDIFKGSANGDVAADSYHKYKEDVAMLKDLGAQVYKFSLSWARILPTGDPRRVNNRGIDYYNRLIDELLKNKIEPVVTLYHWDLPETLRKIGGWTNSLLADYFQDYAKICFTHFGDRVKWWITIHDPLEMCLRNLETMEKRPTAGLGGIAEYKAAHNLLTAHAMVYRMYDKVFRTDQQGKIGIALTCNYITSKKCPADAETAEKRMQFEIGWFAHPILRGDYPPLMREIIDKKSQEEDREKSRLPTFTPDELNFVLGTADFLGVNHYTTFGARKRECNGDEEPSWETDTGVTLLQHRGWQPSRSKLRKVVPSGFRKLLCWIQKEYGNIPIFITGNGFADKGQIKDVGRINYHKSYIQEMLKAISEDDCNILGYTPCSLMDGFEWFEGYDLKFGVYHVDFTSPNRTRTPKESAGFFKKMYNARALPQRCQTHTFFDLS